jgi:hypothetical protein
MEKKEFKVNNFILKIDGDFVGIYDKSDNLLSFRETLEQAVELARLLNTVYDMGYSKAKVFYE